MTDHLTDAEIDAIEQRANAATDEVRGAYVDTGWAVDGSLGDPDGFDRWLKAHDAEVHAQALVPIREALAGHPRCDIHPDGDSITCGWKHAVASVQAVLDAAEQTQEDR